MEPSSATWDPGKNALYVRDTPDILRQKTARMAAVVPQATGANNHMGSRFTVDAATMRVVLATLMEHSLSFVDSFTARGSQGLATARQLGMRRQRDGISFWTTCKTPK